MWWLGITTGMPYFFMNIDWNRLETSENSMNTLIYMKHTGEKCQSNLIMHIHTRLDRCQQCGIYFDRDDYLKCNENTAFKYLRSANIVLELDQSWPLMVVGIESLEEIYTHKKCNSLFSYNAQVLNNIGVDTCISKHINLVKN